jgi:hypothetical protein
MSARYLPAQSEQRWLPCVSGDTSAGLLGYALLVSDGIGPDGVLIVVSLTAAPGLGLDIDPRELFVNSPMPMDDDGDHGSCTKDWPAWVLYDTDDGTPALGEEWGPPPDGSVAHMLQKDEEGFIVVGGTIEVGEGSSRAVWVIPKHCSF